MRIIRQAIKWSMTRMLPSDRWLVTGPRTSKGVALTFDDGPHPEYTPRLLNELQRYGIKATFFVVGRAVERYPHLVQRMVEEGHAVGTHSYTHSEPRDTSTAILIDEVRRSIELCETVIGTAPRLFRPPKGQLTLSKTWKLWGLNQTVVLWNQDPRDYQADSKSMSQWIEGYTPQGGDIVLMHDNHPRCIAAIEPLVRVANAHELADFAKIDDWVPQSMARAMPVQHASTDTVSQRGAAVQTHVKHQEMPL